MRHLNNCDSLTRVTLSNSVTTIGEYAFSRCDSLNSVTIPDSVTSIEEGAFFGCSSLTDVYYGGSESQWEQITIGEYNEPLTGANIHYTSAPAEADPSATTFTDVKTSDYFANAVTWAVNGGVTVGTNDGTTFSPKQICTEVEILTMLYRAAGKPTADPSPVTVASWYQDVVNWAVANGITGGTGGGAFSPDRTCMREEIVTFLHRAYVPEVRLTGNA